MNPLKLLIVTNLHHSSPRIPGMVRYLFGNGVQVTIVTPPLTAPGGRHGAPPLDIARSARLVEVSQPGASATLEETMVNALKRARRRYNILGLAAVRKLTSLYREVVWFPDRDRRWVPRAYRAAANVLSRESFDAILTSSSPVSCHVVGRRLKKTFQLPWIADFRDLWSQNHAYPYSSLRRWIERRFEKRTMSTADAFVTVADLWALRLRRLHGKRTYVVHNGFDDEVYHDRTQLTRTLTITYTGQIYSGKQDPSKFCQAVRELVDEGKVDPDLLEVRFFGPHSDEVADLIAQLHLAGTVAQRGIVSPAESVIRQKESQLLLFFNWEDPTERGIYTQKIFEYLGTQRPIVATGGRHDNDVCERLIAASAAGRYCPTLGEIKGALLSYYEEFRQTGSVAYASNDSAIAPFAFKNLAANYEGIIREVTGRQP